MTTHLVGQERTCRSAPVTADELSSHRGARPAFEVSIERRPDPDSGGLSEVDAAWPRRLRRIVRASLTYWGHPDQIETAELLLTELATNALRHGSGLDVTVRIFVQDDHIKIEVNDGSPLRPALRHAEPYDEGGRGLFLVEAMAEEWGVSDDGTTTWCILPPTSSHSHLRSALMPAAHCEDAAGQSDAPQIAAEFLRIKKEPKYWWEHHMPADLFIGPKTRSRVRTRLTVARWPGNIDAAARVAAILTVNALVHGRPIEGKVPLRLVCPQNTDDLVIEVDDANPDFLAFDAVQTKPAEGSKVTGLWWVHHYRGRLAWQIKRGDVAGEVVGKTVQVVLPVNWSDE